MGSSSCRRWGGLIVAEHIALHRTQRKLYFTRYWSSRGHLARVDLDGSNFELLIDSDDGQPIDVAVDLCSGKLYWTETQHQVHRANLDGTGEEVVVRTDASTNVGGIAVDPPRPPDLSLDASPEDVQAGDTFSLDVEGGTPFTMGWLVLYSVNGLEIFLPLWFLRFDGHGDLGLSGTVPDGLEGYSYSFVALARECASGRTMMSNIDGFTVH